MKKILSLVIITLFSGISISWGQYASIFGDSTSQWSVLYMYPDAYCTSLYEVLGDTVIHGTPYKIVDESSTFYQSTNFIREDTSLGRIWGYNIDSNSEVLLADFNLTVGDTFFYKGSFYIVDKVYSMNGRKYVQFDQEVASQNKDLYFTFIEGVGPSFGLSLTTGDPSADFVLCHKTDTSIFKAYELFDVARSDTCYFCALGVNDLSSESMFSIYPNPTLDELSIRSETYPLNIEIYNMLGRKIHGIKIYNPNQRVNVQEFESGLYILSIIQDERKVYSTIIYKN